jgi:hypothetical protein
MVWDFLELKGKPFNTGGTEVHWVELFLAVFAVSGGVPVLA